MDKWKGILFAVVGSPRERDVLIRGLRRRLHGDPRFVFPRRVVSPGKAHGSEVCQTLTPAQFEMLRRRGAFAINWRADGRSIALPREVQGYLDSGRNVVALFDEAALPEARHRFSNLVVLDPREELGDLDEGGDLDSIDRLAEAIARATAIPRHPAVPERRPMH